LIKVAEMARSFADVFKAGDWAYLAGLWHEPVFTIEDTIPFLQSPAE
jgi:hypothetical protein